MLDYDESIYAQVSQEAFNHHTQLGFTWLGNTGLRRNLEWFEKPPLMIWLTEVGYSIFGINEFAARFWVSLFALGTLVLTYFVVKKLFKSNLAAILALATYFISFQFIYNSRILQFDIPVAFFILLSIFAFQLAVEKTKYFYLLGASLALGLMTKNVIGLLPLPIIFLYSLFTLNFKYLKSRDFYGGVGLFLLIAVPWHLIESIKYGKSFWHEYLFYHVLGRYSAPLENNKGSFWFYWDILFKHRLLALLSIGSLIYFFTKALKDKLYALFLVSTVFIFVFFSCSGTKLPAYILVIYPFLCITVGVTLEKLLAFLNPRLRQILSAVIIIIFLMLGFKYNSYNLKKDTEQYSVDSKKLGLYLKDNSSNLPIYYYSTIGTKPSVIFYSTKLVSFLPYPSPKLKGEYLLISEVTPNYETSGVPFQTPTQSIYLVK